VSPEAIPPVRSTSVAVLAVMHGGVPAQTAEIGLPDVLLVQCGIPDVDLIERDFFGERCMIDGD